MSLFSDNDKERKMTVMWKYLTRYFPKAHREVTKVCVVNNVRYNPDNEPNDISWARGKSPDQLGSAARHMFEYQVDGKIFEHVPPDIAEKTGIHKVYVLAEAMWRIGAELELCIEKQEAERALDQQSEDALFGVPEIPRVYSNEPAPAPEPKLSLPEFLDTQPEKSEHDKYEFICSVSECPGHKVGGGSCYDWTEPGKRPATLVNARIGVNYGYRLKMPHCPICWSAKWVKPSDAIHGAFMCANESAGHQHPVFHFNRDGSGC